MVLVILSSLNIGVATIGALSGMLGAKPDKAMIKSAKLEFANKPLLLHSTIPPLSTYAEFSNQVEDSVL